MPGLERISPRVDLLSQNLWRLIPRTVIIQCLKQMTEMPNDMFTACLPISVQNASRLTLSFIQGSNRYRRRRNVLTVGHIWCSAQHFCDILSTMSHHLLFLVCVCVYMCTRVCLSVCVVFNGVNVPVSLPGSQTETWNQVNRTVRTFNIRNKLRY